MSDNCYIKEENIRDNMFHVKVSRIEEENSMLREEVEKLDEKNLFLERQHTCLQRQLEEVHAKYKELQRECDEQKVLLEEATLKEKMNNATMKKSMKEKRALLGKLETAELEVQELASLKEKLQKLSTEKFEFTKKAIKMTKTLDEKNDECESLRNKMKELQDIINCLRESCETRESALQVLREKSQELADENAELKSLIGVDPCLPVNQLPSAANSNAERYHLHGARYEFNGALQQDSLYDELKVSVLTNTYDENSALNRQLEEQVHWYEQEICTLSKQMKCVVEKLLMVYDVERGRSCIAQNLTYIECPEEIQNIETLRKRIQILLDMTTATPENTRKGIDIGTQIKVNSEAIENLREFSVYNFYEYLEYVFQQNEMTARCGTIGNSKDSPFLSVKLPRMKIVPESSIIDPIVEALDEIVQQTANSCSKQKKKNSKEKSSSKRYRSIYSLKSHRETTRVHDILHGDGNDPLQTNRAIAGGSWQCITTEGEDAKITYKGCRRSKSESSLVIGKRPFSLHCSYNVTMLLSPEKTNEDIKIRNISNDSISKDEQQENVRKTIANNVQNLTCWHGFKFGHTYRCLSDSRSSSVSSSSFRHDSQSSGDFPVNEPCQRQSGFTLAPTRLKLSPNKSSSLHACIDGKSEKITVIEHNEDHRITMDDRIRRNDKISMSSQRLSDFDLESLPETHRPALHSTPIHSNLKNKNFSIEKNKKEQNSTKSVRRSSCDSLIQQFVVLGLSSKINDPCKIHSERLLDRTHYNEHIQSNNSTDARNTSLVDILFDNESFTYSNPLKRCDQKFTKSEITEEYTSDKIRCIATVEGIEDYTGEIRESIDIMTTDRENHPNNIEKSNLANSQNVQEVPDMLKELGHSLEENNNILQPNDIYIPTSPKSSIILNNVYQNSDRLTGSLKLEIVDKEEKLRPPVYYNLKNILIVPSWRAVISYALVFILGYHINNLISSNCIYAEPPYMSWSFEEMFNRYFPIRNMGRLAPI